MSTLGNPAPFGLLCFGMTTFTLMYVDMGWVEHDFEIQVAALAVALGGFGQVLVGIFEILKGSSFSFAVFESYGAFWLTWAIVYIQKTNLNSTWGDAVHPMGSSLYLAQWGVLSFCFWIVTWRKNFALITIFFLLTSTFFLLSISTGTGNEIVRKVGGYFGFATAVAAFYTGIAELINEEYGRPILPGLAPLRTPQRVTITEEAVKNLINYDERTNTIWLQFRGLQIRSLDDVQGIRDGVVATIRQAISSPQAKKKHLRKVHVIADYEQTFISEDVTAAYWKMASSLEKHYYLSATRFHISSFGTQSTVAAVAKGGLVRGGTYYSGINTPLYPPEEEEDLDDFAPRLTKSLYAAGGTSPDATDPEARMTGSTPDLTREAARVADQQEAAAPTYEPLKGP
jgi:succinate-acetate transporter protein